MTHSVLLHHIHFSRPPTRLKGLFACQSVTMACSSSPPHTQTQKDTHTLPHCIFTLYSEAERGSRAGSRLSCSGHTGSSSAHQSLKRFRETKANKDFNSSNPSFISLKQKKMRGIVKNCMQIEYCKHKTMLTLMKTDYQPPFLFQGNPRLMFA